MRLNIVLYMKTWATKRILQSSLLMIIYENTTLIYVVGVPKKWSSKLVVFCFIDVSHHSRTSELGLIFSGRLVFEKLLFKVEW